MHERQIIKQIVADLSNKLTKSPTSVSFLKIILPNNGISLFVKTVLQTSIRFDQLHIIYRSSATFRAFDESKCCFRTKKRVTTHSSYIKKMVCSQRNGEKWQHGNVTNVAITLVRIFLMFISQQEIKYFFFFFFFFCSLQVYCSGNFVPDYREWGILGVIVN
jgi:hypothetical protein